MVKANLDVRDYIRVKRVKYWEVAEKLGILDCNFSRLLRHELSDARKQEIYNAIDSVYDDFVARNQKGE